MFVCSILVTRMMGHSDAVLQYAAFGPCADDFMMIPDANDLDQSDFDEIYFNAVESPKLACSVLGWFGTVPKSMFSMFMMMTLEGWPDMSRTVLHYESGGSPWFILFFVTYVFFTNITLLNL